MIPKEVIELRDRAMNDESYQIRCINGEKVFFYPADKAYAPGHIYSDDGVKEFDISRCCEWHFDNWFAEVD